MSARTARSPFLEIGKRGAYLRSVAFHRSFVWGSALVAGAIFAAVACGGRDQLTFGEDGLGGDDPVGPGGPGQGGFIADGGGGFGPTTTGVGGMPGVTTTTVTTGVGGAPATSSSGVGASTSSSVTTTTGVTTTSGVTTTAVTTATTVTTVNTTVTTTSGAGGMGPSTSAITVSGVGGSSPTTSGGPLDCFACIQGSCPQAAACFQNPACLQGTICAATQCLGGPPDFGCVLNCFNGDFMAAFQALQAVGCVFQQCGQQCQGLFGP